MSLLNNPFNNQKIIKKEDRSKEKQTSTEKTRQKKFQKLYNDYKTQKTKEEEYRQKMLSEREKKELAECSFNPKLTKKNSLYKKKPFEALTQEDKNKNKIKGQERLKSDSKIINLINRQNKWLENKNNKLNQRIVADAIKKVEGCVFEPKIKNISNKISSNLKTESHKLVEKPDSYLNFINKTKKYRESKKSSKDKIKIKNWKSPNRNKIIMDNDYDYTRHELTDNNYLLKNNSSSNYNVNISNSISTKSFKDKERMKKSIPISKLKLTNISNDELYSMIYYNAKEKINKSLNIYLDENIQKLFGDKNQIYFRQAMEGLHQSLINLDLSDNEEDDVELNLNINQDLNENSNGNQNENENENDNNQINNN